MPVIDDCFGREGGGRGAPTGILVLARVINLSFLAPDIIKAILEGRQPVTVTADTIIDQFPLPIDWPIRESCWASGIDQACKETIHHRIRNHPLSSKSCRILS